MKIVNKRFVGIKPVYDIGLEKEHNFVVEGGLVLSNCFNRSHSLAYSWLGWQCAYFKVYYPVQFMAALLSANTSQPKKLARYLGVASKYSVRVLLPDINNSVGNFKTIAGKSVLYGLRGIGGLGDAAIASILTARNEKPFDSLADFCDRVSLSVACIESLVKVGAFDKLIPSRASAITTLPAIHKWAADKRDKDKKTSEAQLTLFAVQEFALPAPEIKQKPEYSELELLDFEKEILGNYLSGHPLDSLPEGALFSTLKPNKRKEVKVTVSVTGCWTKDSRNGVMANLEIEDKVGDRLKAVCWAEQYLKYSYALEKGAFVHLKGKVTEWNERVQFEITEVCK